MATPQFHKIVFLSDCKKFFENIKQSFGSRGVTDPNGDLFEARPTDLPKAAALVNSTKAYFVKQIAAAKLPTDHPETVYITTRRGIFTDAEGAHFETVITMAEYMSSNFYLEGKGGHIPSDCVETLKSLTPADYPFAAEGFAVKINDVIAKAYPAEVQDTWNWCLDAKFGSIDLRGQGVQVIDQIVDQIVQSASN